MNRRHFLRVPGFDEMQNPKRPKRPTWIKSFVRDLDDADRLSLSLTVRGFLSEFEKLAATMLNRVPDDPRFIARKINAPPRVVGKALHTCVTHGLITRFDEDLNTSRDNDIYQKTDTRPIPRSLSPSNSSSPGSTTEVKRTTTPACSHCEDEGCEWCALDAGETPRPACNGSAPRTPEQLRASVLRLRPIMATDRIAMTLQVPIPDVQAILDESTTRGSTA